MHAPDTRSTRRPNLEAQLSIAAGLSARRRDLPAITLAWACGNGWLARKLGPLGPLLLPITGWGHLATAALYRRHILHTPGAAAVLRRPHTRANIDPTTLPAVVLAVLVWATLLSAATQASIWLTILILTFVVIDTLGDRTQRNLHDRYIRLRQHRQRHAAEERVTAPTSLQGAQNVVEISCVAAYPATPDTAPGSYTSSAPSSTSPAPTLSRRPHPRRCRLVPPPRLPHRHRTTHAPATDLSAVIKILF